MQGRFRYYFFAAFIVTVSLLCGWIIRTLTRLEITALFVPTQNPPAGPATSPTPITPG